MKILNRDSKGRLVRGCIGKSIIWNYEKEIVNMYQKEKVSGVKIAKYFNCGFWLIYKILNKNSIEVKGAKYFNKGKIPHNKGRTKENYEPMKRTSEKFIGEGNPNFGKIYNKKHFFDKEDLNNLYHNKRLSAKKIAELKGCSTSTIQKNLVKLDIHRRTNSEVNKGKVYSKDYKKKMSAIKQDIQLEKWEKFTGFEPYSNEFNKRFKLAIKQREGFMCLKCGMREEDAKQLFKKSLHVHHIDYDKKLTIPQNCCALCLRCNIEVNSNRKSWTKFFKSLLSERYGYEYSETGDIILNIGEIKNGI